MKIRHESQGFGVKLEKTMGNLQLLFLKGGYTCLVIKINDHDNILGKEDRRAVDIINHYRDPHLK